MPRTSVIIPVKDRRELLADALDGLDRQEYDDFEVVVVDDGSTDGSGAMAADRRVRGRAVRVVEGHGKGAVQARLAGVAVAEGDVLAFTDSDCVPQPRWLAAAMAAIDDGADAVNGLTQPARPLLPLERSMGSGTEGLYPTCNMLYGRAAYDRVGGFDRSIADRWGWRVDRRTRGDGFGEDTLLAWRLIRHGGRIDHVPEALVLHAVFPFDPADFFSRTLRIGGFAAMVKEIPELRGTLFHHHWQLGARTRLPMYGACASLLARKPAPAGACTAYWTWLRWKELRQYPASRRRRLAALPVELGIDILTGAALLAASAQEWTLVV